MRKIENHSDLTFWIKLRRRLARLFLSQGSCSGSCSDCAVCPIIDKERYTFEIKKRE